MKIMSMGPSEEGLYLCREVSEECVCWVMAAEGSKGMKAVYLKS